VGRGSGATNEELRCLGGLYVRPPTAVDIHVEGRTVGRVGVPITSEHVVGRAGNARRRVQVLIARAIAQLVAIGKQQSVVQYVGRYTDVAVEVGVDHQGLTDAEPAEGAHESALLGTVPRIGGDRGDPSVH